MKPNLLLIAALLLLAAGVLVVVRVTAPPAPSVGTDADANQPPPRTLRGGDRSAVDQPRSRAGLLSASRSSTKSGSSVESPVDEMLRITRSNNPLTQTQDWLNFVTTLDPSEFESVLDAYRGAWVLNEANESVYGVLVAAWARVNPLAALEYANTKTIGPFTRETILTTWATSDPEGAISWAENKHMGDGVNPFMVGVIRGLVASDTERAIELTTAMTFTGELGERGRAISAILPAILEGGADAAKAWAESLGEESMRDEVVQKLVEDHFARKDPRGTADWLVSIGGEGANRSMDNIFRTWVSQDKDEATAYFKTLPSGDLRSSALEGLTDRMATDDPQAAAALIDAYATDTDDLVYRQFAWQSSDPELAANYVSRIPGIDDQERAYRSILSSWLRSDFDAASRWIESNTLSENVQSKLSKRMTELQSLGNTIYLEGDPPPTSVVATPSAGP